MFHNITVFSFDKIDAALVSKKYFFQKKKSEDHTNPKHLKGSVHDKSVVSRVTWIVYVFTKHIAHESPRLPNSQQHFQTFPSIPILSEFKMGTKNRSQSGCGLMGFKWRITIRRILSNTQHTGWGWLRGRGERWECITWHMTHAAQNGPDFSFEGLLSLLKSLVHQVHHIIWSNVSSGRKRESKAKNSVIVQEKMQTNMIIVTYKDNKQCTQ